MPELHVLQEVQRLSHGDIPVRLEEHHGNGTPRKHVSNNKLGQHVETKLGVGDTLHHANGDQEDNRQKHGDDHRPPGQVSVPDQDGDQRQRKEDHKEGVVPPVRRVNVLLHHLQMNVRVLVACQLRALPDLRTVEDGGVDDDGGQGTKGDAVGEREEGTQEERGGCSKCILSCVYVFMRCC